jgi:hypothetical protein
VTGVVAGVPPVLDGPAHEAFRAYASDIVSAAVAKGTFDFVTGVARALSMQALGDVLGVREQTSRGVLRLGRPSPRNDPASLPRSSRWDRR